MTEVFSVTAFGLLVLLFLDCEKHHCGNDAQSHHRNNHISPTREFGLRLIRGIVLLGRFKEREDKREGGLENPLPFVSRQS